MAPLEFQRGPGSASRLWAMTTAGRAIDWLTRCGVSEGNSNAAAQAGRGAGEDVESLHESRKLIKRLRALMRLVRPALAGAVQVPNDALRDAGRALSPYRDAEVMPVCFDAVVARLGRDGGSSIPAGEILAIRSVLECGAGFAGGVASSGNVVAARRDAVDRLRGCLAGWDRLPWEAIVVETLVDGWVRGYRAARRTGRIAAKRRHADALHTWRKRVKDHLYQSEMLAWPHARSGRRHRQLDKLADCLGDIHDLFMLDAAVIEAGARLPGIDHATVQILQGAIRQRRRSLRRRALGRGGLLFEHRPGYWRPQVRNAVERGVTKSTPPD